jgi:UDP-N-acetylglucosamine 1-carboxyvinyltransferase
MSADGDITITGADPSHHDALVAKLRDTGARIVLGDNTIRVTGGTSVSSVDLTTLPYPGFATDLQAQMMSLMTVATGLSVITETVFENRFMHVSELIRMGADIVIQGNSAVVRGVPRLLGAPVMATDLRASASLILAGLVAEGQTDLSRIYHLDRGYERIEEKFRLLGADMERVKA